MIEFTTETPAIQPLGPPRVGVSVALVSLALLTLLIFSSAVLMSCGGKGVGSPCQQQGDCESRFQCLANVCAPRCESKRECGEGYRCVSGGECELVLSSIGDTCTSEWDCGLGQGCVLASDDPNKDQVLEATCQEEHIGGNVGSSCRQDDDCRSSLCALGHCSQVCSDNSDCPPNTGCEHIPRLLENGSALFSGCLQNTGVLSTTLPVDSPSVRLSIPVPSSTKSFSIVASVEDFAHQVGVTRVVSPSGKLLFRESSVFADFFANLIRYRRETKISTMLIPNNNTLVLETGIYEVDLESTLPPFGIGTAIPRVNVFYKLSNSRILDLHFYFLNLDEHPCREKFDVGLLDAATARSSTKFQEDYLGEIKRIFSQADLQIGTISYVDIDRADLDGITNKRRLRELFQLADNQEGIAVFLVRSLSPSGVQALGVGIPGPPRSPNTASSGVAVSIDTLCYRTWKDLARVSAHSIAGQMGLWDSRDSYGVPDPISDSDLSTNNLMFFGEFGGTELSLGQQRVLGLYPGLR